MFTKQSIVLCFFVSAVTLLAGCSTIYTFSEHTEDIISGNRITKTTTQTYKSTLPESVQLTTKEKLHKKYIKIATISVRLYNFAGIKRQQGTLNDIIQQHAAKVGGNAVINLHQYKKTMTGDVVRYLLP